MAISINNLSLRRFLAFGIDWIVLACWAGLLFGIVMYTFSGNPPRPNGPWDAQLIGLITMTIPVFLYFSLFEASSLQATFGKRILNLKVTNKNQLRPKLKNTLFRNFIKFTPWEVGHIVANHAAFSSSTIPNWIYALLLLTFILTSWWVIGIIIHGIAPYEKLSSTRVI